MTTFTVLIPENCKPSNLGFATALVEKAGEYTSEEINIKLDEHNYINGKSILGLLSLRYDSNTKITVQIIGENENYTAPSFERFLNKLIKLYTDEK
jgi:phosphotransferase system HPr-like phosphotransfer protein